MNPRFPADRLIISLDELIALTGWSKRSVLDDCRAKAIDHINRKGSYGFTREQVDALVRRYSVTGSDGESAADREAAERDAVRQANANRRTRSRGRAA